MSLHKKVFKVVLVLVYSLFLINAAPATEFEKLVTKLPDSAMAYIGSSGTDAFAESFDKSYLGQIYNDPSTRQFYNAVKAALLTKLQQQTKDPNQSKLVDSAIDTLKLIFKRPRILGIAERSGKAELPFYFFAFVEAGNRKDEIASAVNNIESLIDANDFVNVMINGRQMRAVKDIDKEGFLYWGFSGSHFVFAVNDPEGLALKNLLQPNTAQLAGLNKVQGTDDVLALHVDCQKIAAMVKRKAAEEGDEKDVAEIASVLKELGLSNVTTLTARVGFAGPDIKADAFLETPAPATGIFSTIKPLDMKIMELVSSEMIYASAGNQDFAGLWDVIFAAIKKVAPAKDYAEIQQEIAKLEAETGFGIRKELLASLTGPMVFYTQGITPSTPMGGFTLIAKLKDDPLFEKSLSALETYIAAQSNGALQVSTQQVENRKQHNWVIAPVAMMGIMPCWTVQAGHVVFCSNSATLNSSIKQLTAADRRATSLLASPEYNARLPKMMPKDIVSLDYIDSTQQFNNTMMAAQQFWPMITMVIAQQGLQLPAMLPQLSHIAEKMQPAYSFAWFDERGLHCRYQGPGVEQSIGAVAGASIGAGILMPALAKARSQAKKMVALSNLRQIGLSRIMYANDFDEKFPPDLQALVEHGYFTDSKILQSPRKPKNFDSPSYIYISGQDATMNPQNIVVYENPEFCTDGVNVLYLDSHVEFVKPDKFIKDLEQTYQRLGRPMPEVKFKR